MKKILGQNESVDKYYTNLYLKEHKYYLTDERTKGEVDFLISAFGNVPNSICDLACGNGRHLEEFAKRKVAGGLGVEPNKALIKFAREKNGNEIFTFENKSFEQWKPKKKYDLVYTLFSSTCYLLENQKMFDLIKKMIAATNPCGLVVIDTENIFPAVGQMDVEYINRNRRLRFDAENMAINSEEEIDGKTLKTSRRYYMASELKYFFELAGLSKDKIKVYGGFDGSIYNVSSERIILTARI